MLRKMIVELIGTFFLVLTIGQVVIEPGAGALAPLAIGSALMVMVFAGGHISGAHYNPAVTLAVFLRRRATLPEVGAYWAAQIVGAVLAVFVVKWLKGDAIITPMVLATGPALVAEFLFTFALAYVVLNVATASGNKGNSHYGLSIGFIVLVGAFAVGGISGGAFNPAVGLGVFTMGLESSRQFGVYLVSEFAGAAVAAFAYRKINGLD